MGVSVANEMYAKKTTKCFGLFAYHLVSGLAHTFVDALTISPHLLLLLRHV